MDKMRVGIVGCGDICQKAYLPIMKKYEEIEIVALSDMNMEVAKNLAEKEGIPKAMTVDEIMKDESIDTILNLTTPASHTEINLMALSNGKNAYVEKPFALNLEDGKKVLALAAEKNLLVGCAPDTFLGAGGQTARNAIEKGMLGRVVAGIAIMQCHGHESWHPNPEFYYKAGGGPMLDMGPYYLSALINLIGSVESVSAQVNTSFTERLITAKAKRGEKITVETPTHIAGTLRFRNGAIITMIMSFDVWAHRHPCLELYGTHGSLSVPDPNTFGGEVEVFCEDDVEKAHQTEFPGEKKWKKLEYSHANSENSRGLGVLDMFYAIKNKRDYRLDASRAYHALEVMLAFEESSLSGKTIMIESTCEKPVPLKSRMKDNEIND